MADIHSQLREDCLILGKFPLCHLLLMRDANYPWFILVPNRDNISEIHQLSADDQMQLLKESSLLAESLLESFQGDKMNIAALGNIVPQLHLHHVVRYQNDPAWPAPIWGKLPAKRYTEEKLNAVLLKFNELKLMDFEYEKIIKIVPAVLTAIFALSLSLSVHAEDMKLEEAKAEISRLEMENQSLKEELATVEEQIVEHKQRLAEFDKIDMTTGLEKSETE